MSALLRALLFTLSGTILVRALGKRSLAQMSVIEVVVLLGLGTVLVHPLKTRDPWETIYHGALIVAGGLALNLIQINFPATVRWISGEPTVLVKGGMILTEHVHRSRMTEANLKMRLRVANVSNITHVKTATLETSGQLGLELVEAQRGVTKQDLDEIKRRLDQICAHLQLPPLPAAPSPDRGKTSLFREAEKEQDPLG